MVGATEAHNIIVSNLHRYIYDPVNEAGCRAFSSDMKLWIETSKSFYYPDIMVTCEPVDPRSVYKTAPCLIVEVLSPSTIDVDRREKLIAYRQLPSLIEYVLAYQDKRQLEVYRKDTNDHWHCTVFTGNDIVKLSAVAGKTIELKLADIYHQSGVQVND